mgnify:FL=1
MYYNLNYLSLSVAVANTYKVGLLQNTLVNTKAKLPDIVELYIL